MKDWICFFISAFFAVIGMASFLFAAVGVFRFDHVLYRMHASALADTVGVACLTISAVVYIGADFVSLKELAVLLLMTLSSPVSTHLLAEIEYTMGNCKKESRRAEDLGGDEK